MAKISGENGEALYGATKTITDASHAGGTVTVTATSHGFSAGDRIKIASVVGMTDLNGYHIITAVATHTFDVSLTTAQSYTSGGTARRCIAITVWSLEETSETIDVTDSGDSDDKEFLPSGFNQWNGSFEGFVITTNSQVPAKGTAISIRLEKDSTNYFSGNAIITRQADNLEVVGTEAVKRSYDFQGDSTLTHTAS